MNDIVAFFRSLFGENEGALVINSKPNKRKGEHAKNGKLSKDYQLPSQAQTA